MKGKIILGAVIAVAIIGGAYVATSMKKVGQGETGVVYTVANGVSEHTLSPGWHFVGPFATVKNYPISQQQLVLSNNAADFNTEKLKQDTHVDAPANGGMVKMNMTINYNFIPERVQSYMKNLMVWMANKLLNQK